MKGSLLFARQKEKIGSHIFPAKAVKKGSLLFAQQKEKIGSQIFPAKAVKKGSLLFARQKEKIWFIFFYPLTKERKWAIFSLFW